MEIKTLSDVCCINMGQSPDSTSYNDKKDGLAFYQGNADFGETHPTTRVWCNNPIKIAEKDDILISVRAPIGSMNIANEKCCIGRGLASIKPIDESVCDRSYLYYFLESKVPYMQSKGTGSTFKAINKGILTNLQIKLPSIDEQHKISSIISKIKRQIHNKNKLLKKYDELVKSQFIEIFGDVNINPKQWEKALIKDIGTCVAGATPSTNEPKYWENGNIPWMSSGEVNKYLIYNTDNKITQLGYDHSSTKLVPPNTVVIAMAGQGKTRGTVGITQIELCTNQSICSIVNNNRINPWFLLIYLGFQYQELRNVSNGSDGRGGLNLKIINSFPVYLPPIELQNQFADFVKHIDKLKFSIKKSIEKLELCYKSLMQEYFG